MVIGREILNMPVKLIGLMKLCAVTAWRRQRLRLPAGTWRAKRAGVPLWNIWGECRRDRRVAFRSGFRTRTETLMEKIANRTSGGVPADQDQNQAGLGSDYGAKGARNIIPKSFLSAMLIRPIRSMMLNFSRPSTNLT